LPGCRSADCVRCPSPAQGSTICRHLPAPRCRALSMLWRPEPSYWPRALPHNCQGYAVARGSALPARGCRTKSPASKPTSVSSIKHLTLARGDRAVNCGLSGVHPRRVAETGGKSIFCRHAAVWVRPDCRRRIRRQIGLLPSLPVFPQFGPPGAQAPCLRWQASATFNRLPTEPPACTGGLPVEGPLGSSGRHPGHKQPRGDTLPSEGVKPSEVRPTAGAASMKRSGLYQPAQFC